jgi:hypothetical protein
MIYAVSYLLFTSIFSILLFKKFHTHIAALNSIRMHACTTSTTKNLESHDSDIIVKLLPVNWTLQSFY